jgi:hypothetical protein
MPVGRNDLFLQFDWPPPFSFNVYVTYNLSGQSRHLN